MSIDDLEGVSLADLDTAALKNRRAELLKELEGIDEALSSVQVHMLDTSVRPQPVRFCRDTFEAMFPEGKTRKEIIDFCVSRGVAQNTAATQYALNKRHWEQYGCVPQNGNREVPNA